MENVEEPRNLNVQLPEYGARFTKLFEFLATSKSHIFTFCLLPFAFCLRSSVSAEDLPVAPLGAARGVVQLLAIGPGAGDKKHECAATGFLINDEGHILTNAHVVEEAHRCLASSPGAKILARFGPGDGRTVQAIACDVVAVDEELDLAVLKTEIPLPEGQRGSFLRLRADSVPEGTRVAVTGHPSFVWQPSTFEGKVIARQALALSERSRRRTEVLVLDIPLQRGASGSPVLLESGEVVGVVERQRPSNRLETVAVPAAQAILLLDRHNIQWTPGRDSGTQWHCRWRPCPSSKLLILNNIIKMLET